jgi:hypothetical protein
MSFIQDDEVVLPRRNALVRLDVSKEWRTSEHRLFEREWISILTTSDQHRIHSKLRFRKNMPFFGSVRYHHLRRKSATKSTWTENPKKLIDTIA